MIREYTATGATVEEAIENACRELGVSPLDVTPEILKLPKKGFFKKTLAEVRITVQSDEELMKEKPASPAAASKKPTSVREKAEKAEKPAPAPKQEERKAEKENPVSAEKKSAPDEKELPSVQEEAAAPVSEAPAAPVEKLEDLKPKMDAAEQYLRDVFEKMGLKEMEIRLEQTENRTVLIHLDGDAIGTVIGKHGETLDAIQYLVSLAANRQEGEYVRFTINAGNYRERREETLRALAQRMAKKVLKTGRPAALEPMNPYERRIIHAVVTEIEGVYSKSTGEEPNRKVVIKPSGRNGAARRENGRSRGNRPPRSAFPAPVAEEKAETAELPREEEPVKEPKLDTAALDGVKLYSKIEL